MASGTPSTYRLGQRCVASRERSSAVSRTGSDIRRRTRILATNATRRSKSVLTLSYDHTRVSPVQDRARIRRPGQCMSPTSIELGRGMCVLRMVSVNHEVGVPLERGTDWGSGGKEARDGRGWSMII